MLHRILGVQMLDQLIAVGKPDRVFRQWQRATICQVNVKISRCVLTSGDSTGNVYRVHLLHRFHEAPRERKIARPDLQESKIAREQRRKEVQLALDLRRALARVAPLQLRMVGDPAEQLLIDTCIQHGALLRRGIAQTLRKPALDLVVLAQLLGRAAVARPAPRGPLPSGDRPS